MPTVRKTSRGREMIHSNGMFEHGTEREVSADVAAYLVEEKGGYEYVNVTENDSPEAETPEESNPAEPEPVTNDDLDVDESVENGECPWCIIDGADDPYEGEYIGRHASAAHPEEWQAYSDGDA